MTQTGTAGVVANAKTGEKENNDEKRDEQSIGRVSGESTIPNTDTQGSKD